MVVIRLSLRSRPKNNKHYQILVADQRRSPKGAFIERVGSFDPLAKENNIQINLERVEYWVSQGAQLTPRVKQVIKQFKKAQ